MWPCECPFHRAGINAILPTFIANRVSGQFQAVVADSLKTQTLGCIYGTWRCRKCVPWKLRRRDQTKAEWREKLQIVARRGLTCSLISCPDGG
jgi:hypothetical protein